MESSYPGRLRVWDGPAAQVVQNLFGTAANGSAPAAELPVAEILLSLLAEALGAALVALVVTGVKRALTRAA